MPFTRGILMSRRMTTGKSSTPARYEKRSRASLPSRMITTRLARWMPSSAARVNSISLALSSTNQIGLSIFFTRSFLAMIRRQREIKGSPCSDGSFRPDPSAMPLDNAPRQRQTDAGAFEILLAVEALKDLKELLVIAHVEADAVIANESDRFSVRFDPRCDGDFRRIAPARELN